MEERSSLGQTLRPVLPWLAFAAALITYALTLNHWVTLASAPAMSKMMGWDRFPTINSPILYLLTRPFLSLPVSSQPLALNAMAALFGAGSIWLLTRCVLLLPHDRTKEQRTRERSQLSLLSVPTSWIPPLAAGLSLAFQLTFWEHSTSQTGETLDLLFFSLSVYLLLDYRLSKKESQLYKLAVVYGVGVTNNWALIAFFPLFLAALVWIKGRSFFSFQFIGRMMALGLIGLTPFLLLPYLASRDASLGSSFLELMRQQLGSEKNALLQFPRSRLLFLSLTSILPVVFMGVRWPSSFGDTSAAGTSATNLMFRVLHALFLAACSWVMFDPQFAPRQLGNGYAMLPLYFLTALAIGYYSGYFLLIFSEQRSKSAQRSGQSPLAPLLRGLVAVAALALPIAILGINLPLATAKNGPALKAYASSLYASLPKEPAVVLSDNRYDLLLLEGLQRESGRATRHRLIETKLLEWRFYHKSLARSYPKQLEELPNLDRLKEPIDSSILVQQLVGWGKSNSIFYLHPSFGYYFEAGYLKPKGSVFQMVFYSDDSFTPPALPLADVEAIDRAWEARIPELKNIAAGAAKKVSDQAVLGAWYSRTLNYLGTEFQKAGRIKEAGRWFELATQLNPENVAAIINRQHNDSRVKQASKAIDFSVEVKELIKRYATWGDLLVINGPIDEPTFCFDLGTQFAQAGNVHQAVTEFLRVASWEPNNLLNQIALARAYHFGLAPQNALRTIDSIEKNPASSNLQPEHWIELARIRALARFAQKDYKGAEETLLQARSRYPREPKVLDALFDLYYHQNDTKNALAMIESGLQSAPNDIDLLFKKVGVMMQARSFPEAMAVITQILELQPNNELALLNQGAILIHNKRYTEALKPLERILERDSNHYAAKLNRAIVFLQTEKWTEANADYLSLAKKTPDSHLVVYGVAETSFRLNQKEKAAAAFERYLAIAPPDTTEIQNAKDRLKSLR